MPVYVIKYSLKSGEEKRTQFATAEDVLLDFEIMKKVVENESDDQMRGYNHFMLDENGSGKSGPPPMSAIKQRWGIADIQWKVEATDRIFAI